MDSASKPFLFVNKTQSSRILSRSEGTERAHVQSHTQQVRRSRENRAAGASRPWIIDPRAADLKGAVQRKSRTKKLSNTKPSTYSSQSLSSTSSTPQTPGASWEENPQNGVLTPYPSRNSSDPFNCTIAGDDISHYHHVILGFISGQSPKVTFFAEAFAPAMQQHRPSPMRHDAAVSSRLRSCVQDRALMYSTLAYGANLLGWMGGVSDAFKPAEYFTGQAIQAVRERILAAAISPKPSGCASDSQLAMSIYSLAISELWKTLPLMQNQDSVSVRLARKAKLKPGAPLSRMHLQALLELVNSSGGWQKFDPYVLESAILADKYLACWEWTAPVISISSLPAEYNFPIPSADTESTSGTLGRKLLVMDLHPKLRDVTSSIIQYVSFAKQAWALAPLPFDVQSGLFFRLQRMIYELLYLVDLDGVDNCIRIAALIFLQTNMHYRGAHICAVTLVTQLRPALVAAQFWRDVFPSDLRLWCLFSGLLVTEPSGDEDWFQAMLQKYLYSHQQNAPSLSDVQASLEGYLYMHERQGRQLAIVLRSLATN